MADPMNNNDKHGTSAAAGPDGSGLATVPGQHDREDLSFSCKERARTLLMPYNNLMAARIGRPCTSDRCRLLNGSWEFRRFPEPGAVPEDFPAAEFDSTRWDRITVPGHWQLQGFGTPAPASLDHPLEPLADDLEVGCYRQRFSLPEAWHGEELFLMFEGVDAAFHLWVNGTLVGYSQDRYNPAEFRVTDVLQAGENLVAIQVHCWSEGACLDNPGIWRLNGIFRDVILYAEPRVCLRDVQASSSFSPDCKQAVLKLLLDIHNHHAAASIEDLTLSLLDPFNTVISQLTQTLDLEAASATVVEVDLPIAQPFLWTAETPNLYQLLFKLGSVYYSLRIGLRTIDLVHGELHINGHRTLLRGVDIADFHPAAGRALTEAEWTRDLTLLRDHNINAIRCTYHPKMARFYELCDRWGFYVIDHPGLATIDFEEIATAGKGGLCACMDRMERTVSRNRNHACIIAWSLGDSYGNRDHHRTMVERIRELDPQRPIVSEHDTNHIDWIHLCAPDLDTLREPITNEASVRPVLLQQFCCSRGNGLGSLQEYWERIETTPRIIGGFIREWCDHALNGGPGQGYLYAGQPAAAIRGLDGVTFPDRTPKPALEEIKKVFQPAGFKWQSATNTLQVRNKQCHTDLAGLLGRWRLNYDGKTIDGGAFDIPRIRPGADHAVQLAVSPVKVPGEAVLTVSLHTRSLRPWTESRHEVAWEQFVLPPQIEAVTAEASADRSIKWNFQADTQSFLASPEASLILAAPALSLWRAPLQNDFSMETVWRQIGLDTLSIASRNRKATDDTLYQETVWQNDTGTELVRDQVQIILDNTGRARFKHSITPLQELPILPRIGLRMKLNSAYDRVLWYGRGPHENLYDRCYGAKLLRHESSIDKLAVPYIWPQENGQRSDVRWLELGGPDLPYLHLSFNEPGTFTLRRHTVEDLDAAKHLEELPTRNFIELCIDHRHAGTDIAQGASMRDPRGLPTLGDSLSWEFSITPLPQRG